MIRAIFIFCWFLLVQDEPVISWSESYKLTWADFKDNANTNTSAVAITASGISFGYSIKQTETQVVDFSTEVYAHFYPEQSWYKPEGANAHVLAHEQLHFDITELHARKLRYRISELGISNTIKRKLRQLQNEINEELKMLQNKYDSETDHSRNFETQAQWNAYIAKELKAYSRFKSK